MSNQARSWYGFVLWNWHLWIQILGKKKSKPRLRSCLELLRLRKIVTVVVHYLLIIFWVLISLFEFVLLEIQFLIRGLA